MADDKITRDTVLADILKYRGAEKILLKHGVPCLHCPMVAVEADMLKIGEVSDKYGINTADLLKELNELKNKKGTERK